MKNFFYKNKKKLYINKDHSINDLLKKILVLKRKNNNFSIMRNQVARKIICIESKNTRSVHTDFSLSRMNIKNHLGLGTINGLKKLS
jgi:ribosomal protein S14